MRIGDIIMIILIASNLILLLLFFKIAISVRVFNQSTLDDIDAFAQFLTICNFTSFTITPTEYAAF